MNKANDEEHPKNFIRFDDRIPTILVLQCKVERSDKTKETLMASFQCYMQTLKIIIQTLI